MPASVPIGIASPNALNVQISSVRTDMRTITGISLLVRRADGTEVTWNATIDPTKTTATYLEANHVFAVGGGDCPMLGAYHVFPQLVPPGGGDTSCTPDTLVVVAQ